ncbi:MAG: DUF975 family protein [Treponemataceae bacterium]|nr:DUF975 family protein [Treponemataceae bacterium]
MTSDLFDRKSYKTSALKQLKGSWTTPVLITLVILLITSMMNTGTIIQNYNDSDIDLIAEGGNFSMNVQKTPSFTIQETISSIISLLSIIVGGILEIACCKFYLKIASFQKASANDFIEALNLWAKGILETLWSNLFIILWSMLFVIPGIIKAISYSQAFYILAEFPSVSITQALKISQKIMKGYKADYFVMQLSFIGWGLLACLTCGIGFLWLIPYIQSANANAHKFLMQNAIDKHRVTYAELHGGVQESNNN